MTGSMLICDKNKPSTSFYHLLRRTSGLHCSDPRDHIYALLGLVKYDLVDSALQITPNYVKDVFDVYKDFTWRYILASNNPAILERAGFQRRQRMDIVSSWVADFTFNDINTRHNIPTRHVGACGNLHGFYRLHESESLVTHALRCDIIQSTLSIGEVVGISEGRES